MIILWSASAQARGPVNAACARASKATLALNRQADSALARHDARAANSYIDAALRTLGTAYYAPPMIDDTGQHLIVARMDADTGHFREAASNKRRIIIERMQLCGIAAPR